MPVTARLSKRFYDRLGEEVTNELVEWFNAVDATYRNDLRELNELNFARFDAKLEQRFAQYDAKLEQRFAQSDAKLEQRFAQYDAKWEQRFAQSDVKLEQRFAQFEQRFAEFKVQLAEFEAKIERRFNEQTRWFYLAWAMQFAAIVGLYLR